jgi:hypothetical protein
VLPWHGSIVISFITLVHSEKLKYHTVIYHGI